VLLIKEAEATRCFKRSKNGCLDPFAGTELLKPGPASGWNSQDHAFLRFRNPDFGIGEPFILEQCSVEMDHSAERLPHLADSGAEPPRSAIGDGMIEAQVA